MKNNRQQAKITKGENKGKPAFIVNSQKEEIGNGLLYVLECRKGKKIYNGNLTWFPESFIQFCKTA